MADLVIIDKSRIERAIEAINKILNDVKLHQFDRISLSIERMTYLRVLEQSKPLEGVVNPLLQEAYERSVAIDPYNKNGEWCKIRDEQILQILEKIK